MTPTKDPSAPRKRPLSDADARQDRLKAALKANMGRRKAQARARSLDEGGTDIDEQHNGGTTREA